MKALISNDDPNKQANDSSICFAIQFNSDNAVSVSIITTYSYWHWSESSSDFVTISATKHRLAESMSSVLASKPSIMTTKGLLTYALGRLLLISLPETRMQAFSNLASDKLTQWSTCPRLNLKKPAWNPFSMCHSQLFLSLNKDIWKNLNLLSMTLFMLMSRSLLWRMKPFITDRYALGSCGIMVISETLGEPLYSRNGRKWNGGNRPALRCRHKWLANSIRCHKQI